MFDGPTWRSLQSCNISRWILLIDSLWWSPIGCFWSSLNLNKSRRGPLFGGPLIVIKSNKSVLMGTFVAVIMKNMSWSKQADNTKSEKKNHWIMIRKSKLTTSHPYTQNGNDECILLADHVDPSFWDRPKLMFLLWIANFSFSFFTLFFFKRSLSPMQWRETCLPCCQCQMCRYGVQVGRSEPFKWWPFFFHDQGYIDGCPNFFNRVLSMSSGLHADPFMAYFLKARRK